MAPIVWTANLRAAAWLMAANVLFVGVEVFGKQLVDNESMNPIQVLWLRALFTVLALPLLVRRSPIAIARTNYPKLQLMRSALLMGAGLCFFFSLQEVPLGDAVAIVFVSPLFMTAIAFFFLKELVGWRRWMACLIGFAGALLIIQPGMGVRHWMYLLPLGDALFSAIYAILTRRIGLADSTSTSLFYSVLGMATLFGIPMIWLWEMPSGEQWLFLLGISIFGLMAHFSHIRAYSEGEASLLAPLSYIHVVFTTFTAFVVFGTLPDPIAAGGIVLIVGAGLYILHRETIRRGHPRPVPPPGPEPQPPVHQ
jgi:drug/metabolite transporter (DMT)-like permease